MKSLKLKTYMLTFAFAVTASGVSALPINNPIIDLNGDEITISGQIPNAKSYENITFELIRPGKEASNIGTYTKENILKTLVSYCQTTADKDGNYSIAVDMEGLLTEEYLIRVSSDTTVIPYKLPIFYSSYTDRQIIVNDTNAVTTAGQLKALLDLKNSDSRFVKYFNLTNPLILSVNDSELSKILLVINQTNVPNNPTGLMSNLMLSAVLQGLNEGKIPDILSCKDILNLNSGFINIYKTKVSDKAKQTFMSNFMSKSIDTVVKANKIFQDSVILTVLNNPQNWSDFIYIIDNYGTYMGLDLTQYNNLKNKEALAVRLGEQTYSDFDDFEDKFNSAVNSLSTPPKDDKKDGGGSKSTVSGGLKTVPVPLDNIVKSEKQERFVDLENAKWAKEYIETLVDKGIVEGVGENTFEPNRLVLKEEFVKMLVKAFKIEITNETVNFTDIQNDAWYYSYISSAFKAGIVNGTDNGEFGIGKYITREEMATLAYRAAKYAGISLREEVSEKFGDDGDLYDYSKAAVYSMKNAKIIDGVGDNRFAPKDSCTRAQAAKIICGLITLGGDA